MQTKDIRSHSSGGRVVKLLACGARGSGVRFPASPLEYQIGYLLLPSRDMAEIPLKRRKSSIKPNQTRAPRESEWDWLRKASAHSFKRLIRGF